MRTTELAGLKVHLRGGAVGAAASPLVILLHGYGAPGVDLVSLADEIVVPPGTRFLFPEAPIDLAAEAPELVDARAWWPIDVIRVQVAMMSGAFDDLAAYLRPGLARATEKVAQLVEAASQRFGVDRNRIVLGGFSQGAIVSLEVTLEHQWHVAGLLLFSGSMVEREWPLDRARALAPMPCVISHGTVDPILPFSLADRLRSDLTCAGWDVDWVPFVGGHGIPPKAASAAGRLISRNLA